MVPVFEKVEEVVDEVINDEPRASMVQANTTLSDNLRALNDIQSPSAEDNQSANQSANVPAAAKSALEEDDDEDNDIELTDKANDPPTSERATASAPGDSVSPELSAHGGGLATGSGEGGAANVEGDAAGLSSATGAGMGASMAAPAEVAPKKKWATVATDHYMWASSTGGRMAVNYGAGKAPPSAPKATGTDGKVRDCASWVHIF